VYRVYERRLLTRLQGQPVPRHVAIMIDGNRRWARAAGFDDVAQGHAVGAEHITDLLNWCTETGVGHVTIWLLSTDNLRRPAAELEPLLRIIGGVAEELSGPHTSWRVTAVGALDLLPAATAETLKTAAERTADRDGLQVNIAVGYGGRREIADAVRSLLQEHAAAGAASLTRTSSSGRRGSSGCRAFCSGSPSTRSSISATPSGRTSAKWTSCAPCATTALGSAASAVEG
jgi:short-chain Z-isoprenyl diphosphate synthase